MSENVAKEGRKKFTIELTEHESYDAIAQSMYLTSTELCHYTSDLFRSVFADFEGCVFETINQGKGMPVMPTISLFFNHKPAVAGEVRACELPGANSTGSTVIDAMHQRDRRLTIGDRYHITQDGKDVFETLLFPYLYNNGKINWGQIVSECTENATQSSMFAYGGYHQPQYTKISGIDPNRLVDLIFGNKDKDGNKVEYNVSILTVLNPAQYANIGSTNMNYLLNISRVSEKELDELCNKMGLGNMFGARIIR
jgi:hypothetical protein